MQRKSKHFFIGILFILVLLLLFTLLFKINSFMEEYELCKDDFKAIQTCGCLPLEGNYKYFEKDYVNDEVYEIGEIE